MRRAERLTRQAVAGCGRPGAATPGQSFVIVRVHVRCCPRAEAGDERWTAADRRHTAAWNRNLAARPGVTKQFPLSLTLRVPAADVGRRAVMRGDKHLIRAKARGNPRKPKLLIGILFEVHDERHDHESHDHERHDRQRRNCEPEDPTTQTSAVALGDRRRRRARRCRLLRGVAAGRGTACARAGADPGHSCRGQGGERADLSRRRSAPSRRPTPSPSAPRPTATCSPSTSSKASRSRRATCSR